MESSSFPFFPRKSVQQIDGGGGGGKKRIISNPDSSNFLSGSASVLIFVVSAIFLSGLPHGSGGFVDEGVDPPFLGGVEKEGSLNPGNNNSGGDIIRNEEETLINACHNMSKYEILLNMFSLSKI